jgi:hypothetical protein
VMPAAPAPMMARSVSIRVSFGSWRASSIMAVDSLVVRRQQATMA